MRSHGSIVPILSAPNSVNQTLPPGPVTIPSGAEPLPLGTGISATVASRLRDSRRSNAGPIPPRPARRLFVRFLPPKERRTLPGMKVLFHGLSPSGRVESEPEFRAEVKRRNPRKCGDPLDHPPRVALGFVALRVGREFGSIIIA